MTSLIERLTGRIDETRRLAAGRFPMSADAVTGEWDWSPDGGWFGGFWPGLLRLAAVASGDTAYIHAADGATAQLASRLTSPTVLRGLLFWYSAGIGGVLNQASDRLAGLAAGAAHQLRTDFDPAAGLIPPGSDDVALYDWPRPGAVIDGLPGTIPLLTFAADRTGDASLRQMAASNARAYRAMCVRPDGSIAQSATYDPAGALAGQTTIEGSSPHSTWARAQAWAMLGFTQAACRMPEFLDTAVQIADWYLSRVPDDRVCFWDFDDPAIPNTLRDTSATAIAGAALVKLAALAGDRYRDAAATTLAALTHSHLNSHGALTDGCYDRVNNIAIRNELIWGDYFLFETALALDGAIDSTML